MISRLTRTKSADSFEEKTMTRNCECCNEALKGRLDKRFCNDDCRSAWHNHRKSREYHAMHLINHALTRNRRILLSLIPEQEQSRVVTRDELLFNGFHFQYHTETHFDGSGLCYSFCYEFGYAPLDGNKYQLVRSFLQHSVQ